MSARHRSYFLLLIVAIIWGFATPIIKYTFTFISPGHFLTYRFFISTIVMLPILFLSEPDVLRQLTRLDSKDWCYFLLGGLLGSTGQLGLLFWGLNLTTSLDGSIINATSPILVSLAGFFFLKEKITSSEKLGLVIAFLGSIIIVLQPLFEGHSIFSGNVIGNFLVFLGTLAWVIYVITTKKGLNNKLSPLLLTTNMFVIGFISMLFIVTLHAPIPTIINSISTAPFSAHMGVLYMALFSGTIAYWLYQKAQELIEASEANIILYLSPIFTFPVAYFWLGEPITPLLIIGSVTIILGVLISQFKR